MCETLHRVFREDLHLRMSLFGARSIASLVTKRKGHVPPQLIATFLSLNIKVPPLFIAIFAFYVEKGLGQFIVIQLPYVGLYTHFHLIWTFFIFELDSSFKLDTFRNRVDVLQNKSGASEG